MLANCATIVCAENVGFEALVNSPRISMDEVMQLTLTVTGVNDNLDPINLPVLEGFSAKYVGPSTSVSIINGDYHSERSFVYNLFPNKVGKFQIPAISISVNGKTYTSKPIDVEVSQNPTQASPGVPSAPDQNSGPSADSLKDKILISVSVGKNNVYLNEKIPVSIKLLVNDVPMRDIQLPQFDKTGFMVDDYQKPEQNTEIVNGVKYDTVEFKTNVYPSRLGDISFGPVQLQGNVIYKATQANPFNQENNPFGADIFNGFFDSYANRPVTVTSKPIELHVSELPSENKPGNFSGAMGQFAFKVTVSPLQVKAGDPLTLKMDLTGAGNFKSIKMPDFKAHGFKSYEPKVKDTDDEKTAEEVIIPVSSSIKEVPVIKFSYFDTDIKDYRTITQGPFPIQVIQPGPDQDFKAVGFTDLNRDTSSLPSKQFSIGKMFGKFQKFFAKLSRNPWFWIWVGLMLVIGVVYIFWRKFQDRLENDPAFARKLKALREAREALKPAEQYMAEGKSKEFYALVSKVLKDYFANKWHQSSAALSTSVILEKLKALTIDEAIILQVKSILEQSDLVCFAGASRDALQMKNDISQVQEIIKSFEKALK